MAAEEKVSTGKRSPLVALLILLALAFWTWFFFLLPGWITAVAFGLIFLLSYGIAFVERLLKRRRFNRARRDEDP